MSTNEPASSNTLLAINQLRALIVSGQLGGGTDHLESELATRLGMSRTPVREALLRLECEGLLEIRPRKGVRIKPFTPEDMEEVYDLLIELEGLAAAKAAARNLTEMDLAPLATALADMETALNNCARDDWSIADDTFHSELARLSGSYRISRITQLLSDQMHRARHLMLYIRPAPVNSVVEHRQLLEAIRAGDSDRARQVQRDHRIAAKTQLIALLETHQLSTL